MKKNMQNKIGILSVMTRYQFKKDTVSFDADSIKDSSVKKKVEKILGMLDESISRNKIIDLIIKVDGKIVDTESAMFRSDISRLKEAINNHFVEPANFV